ncbi:MAG: cytochrome c biogenesis protein CcsA [Candidatus Thalassarchaeaceae archaeon]|nr:cytochrome c biogenesis protein CcsA [Candidatus Thalassarchaeaceae archaeon]
MLTFLGYTLIFLALLVSVYLVFRPEASSDPLVRTTSMAAQSAPFLFLATSFLIEATTLDLVSRYVGDGLPLFYRISAVWGSRSGPLLMWASMMSVITWVMSRDHMVDSTAIRVMHSWTALLLLVSAGLRPFSPAIPGSAGEISPLLQTDLMVIHPPVVFVYYSLCLATASIALSGLIMARPSKETHASMIRWARYSFLAGTVGIGLGGLWAYTVLDWGGYWAWDPVETGSLLPWLALLAILHSRARAQASNPFAFTPALGLICGALVMHATLVTRANGVWASVHAFVGDGENSLPRDPYVRVVEIIDFTAVGFEVLVYLLAVMGLLCLSVAHVLREQRAQVAAMGSQTLFETNRTLAISLLVYFAAVGLWIGSSAVLFFGLAIMILLIFGDRDEPPVHWVSMGVLLMLFSGWGWVSEWYQSLAGIVPFLLVWVIPEEEKDDFSWIIGAITDANKRATFSRSFPWYLSMAFLLLTWILLTVEIEGTNIAAHEYYGAPLISLLAIGLALYAWGEKISGKAGTALLVFTTIVSVLLAANSGSLELPGNQSHPITDSISRGALSVFILTWLVFAIPPTLVRLWHKSREIIPELLRSGGTSQPSKARLLGTHVAHAGILILLVGHVLTTTLVDRTDPSHFVTLEKDVPTEHQGMELMFTEVEIFSAEEDGYDYEIGDGYVGVVIEVRDEGEILGTIRPGMLRFDSPSGAVSARSEVDRMSGMTGDTIVILDLLQSNELLSSMILGQTDQVEEVRVTIHHLPGSHLVWSGWLLVILGSALSSLPRPSVGMRNNTPFE